MTSTSPSPLAHLELRTRDRAEASSYRERRGWRSERVEAAGRDYLALDLDNGLVVFHGTSTHRVPSGLCDSLRAKREHRAASHGGAYSHRRRGEWRASGPAQRVIPDWWSGHYSHPLESTSPS